MSTRSWLGEDIIPGSLPIGDQQFPSSLHRVLSSSALQGFREPILGLNAAREPNELPLILDNYFPIAMACANYLKLPPYSSEEVVKS